MMQKSALARRSSRCLYIKVNPVEYANEANHQNYLTAEIDPALKDLKSIKILKLSNKLL